MYKFGIIFITIYDMLKDQCISVTDLRIHTKKCLENLEEEPKYIFINNRPIAVLVDVNEYEEHFLKPELMELPEGEADSALKKQAADARKSKKDDLINIR